MKNKENIPVFTNPQDMIKYSNKLRKENNGKLIEALIIFESERTKDLFNMQLTENGFELELKESLTPKKHLKYIKNKETGEMELDFN